MTKRRRGRRMPANLILIAVAAMALIGFVRETATSCRRATNDNATAVAQQTRADDTYAAPADIKDLLKVAVPRTIADSTLLIDYPGFTVRFDPRRHVPQYVAWDLSPMKARGTLERSNNFAPDDNIDGCATLADYKGSGFSRGHMAPSADMKWSADAMDACFLLTNMCPQDQKLNNGAWKSVEEKCRQWAQRDSTLVIICGPVLTDRMPRVIGESRVTVPERFFKVILAPYADPPRGIAFVMPNGRVPGGMQAAAVSIDDVEQITGLDFFAALPDDIEQEVESQCNFPRWTAKK